ncbi:MAG: hypothetical protein WEC75_06830 [Dehalococcoidia bacterium]
MRLGAFIVALLLLAGSVDPTRGWLIALVVLSGFAALRPRFGASLRVRPVIDARLASFVLAVLLLAGTVDATRDWLIAMAAVSGVAAFFPRMFSIDLDRRDDRRHRWRERWHREWNWDFDEPWS